MRRVVKWTLFPAAIMFAALAGGFLWFLAGIGPAKSPPDVRTDAIVVLTGGSERIASGLSLLARGKAKKLFVSGVGRGTEAEDLTRGSPIDRATVACCVTLGYAADNTSGNAVETAEWLRQQGFHSLRLVTSNYHLRRAMLEFRRVLPAETIIIADPVAPAPTGDTHAARVIVLEYVKYLIALARPAFERTLTTAPPQSTA